MTHDGGGERRSSAKDEIRGTWATILTPFDADDALDTALLDEELTALFAASPQGVYTHGTAGEFFNQTDDEWDLVVTRVGRRCVAASMPFQLGANHSNPVVTVDRIRRARELEPAAIQVALPSWLELTTEETLECLRMFSEAAAGVGLVLYNSPHSKNVLDPEGLALLCERVPGLVGIKTGDGDAGWYERMRPVMDRVSVFVPGHHLATGLRSGAHGAYSNVACLSPRGAVLWGERSRVEPEWGLEVERDIRRFMDQAILPLRKRGYSAVTLDKTLAAAGGHLGDIGRVRRPFSSATPQEVDEVRRLAFELLPDFLHPGGAPPL